MPRPPNPSRASARAEGSKTYSDELNPCMCCGGDVRYTSNAQCVACAIAKGRDRYAGLDDEALAALKAKDADRYAARLAANRQPRRRNRSAAIERDPLDP